MSGVPLVEGPKKGTDNVIVYPWSYKLLWISFILDGCDDIYYSFHMLLILESGSLSFERFFACPYEYLSTFCFPSSSSFKSFEDGHKRLLYPFL